MNQEKITQKIKNLLDLANNNPSENEAKAALLKAQELMLKYNISISDEEMNRDSSSVVTKSYRFEGRRLLQYHLSLAGIIAKNFRTKTYYTRRGIHFMGFTEDATTSQMLLEYLINFIDTGFNSFLKQDKKNNPEKYFGRGPQYSKFIKRSWIQGFLSGLRQAFKERSEDSTYELMLVTPNAVMEKYEELSLTKSNLKSNYEVLDNKSFNNGFDTGKNSLAARELQG